MKNTSKIAVIGGTGKAGKYIVQELLNRGYRLKLLLRFPEKFQLNHSSVEPIKGDVRDPFAVVSVMQECDAIVSAIGQPRNEESIFSQATRNIVEAMGIYNLRRYISLTGLNVDTPSDNKNEKVKMATDWMRANYPKTTADKQVEYEFLTNSDIDWTLVRLPMIELTNARREVKVSLENCPGEVVSATDLAHFVADQLTDNSLHAKAPFLASV